MFPGIRSSLVFSGFGLKPPASGFQPYSYSSLKTSPSLTSKVVPSVLASVCWSLQCLISTLTQGGGGGHFFRLTCSVVLLEGRDAVNKYHWHLWGVLAVFKECVLYNNWLFCIILCFRFAVLVQFS